MSEPAFEDNQKFEILGKLAEGGMGVVYRARHVGLDKLVALKVLNTACNDDTAIVRFQNEAKTLSRLSHRSIAGVYDFGISKSGEPFMAIEFVEGVTLQGLLEERRRLTVDEALPIFIQIAEALSHAHQRGVVHRDIKPSNIIIQENDSEMLAKVVDFGIAKDAFSDTGDLTRTGGLIGSPLYMSPEQTLGQDITPQSDMYSLGCVIYHSLIGKPPFAGETIFDTITKHREAPIPSMQKRLPEIPFELDELVTRLLAKEPALRYRSMTVVQNILTRIFEGTVGDSQGNPVIEDLQEEEKAADMLKATLLIDSGEDSKSTRKVAIGIVAIGLVAVGSVAIAVGFSLRNELASVQSMPVSLGDKSQSEEACEAERAIRKMLKSGKTDYDSILWTNEPTDDDMKVFQGTKVAKNVSFSDIRIGDKALIYLADSPLQILNLRNTRVKTLEFMPAGETLEELQLGGTHVGDDALARLSRFRKLNCLYLDQTDVTAAGIRKHLKMVPINELRLNDCPNITAGDIDALLTEFPMWKILPWKKGYENRNYIDLEGVNANVQIAKGQPQKAVEIWNHWNRFADSHKDSDPNRRLKVRALTNLAASYDFIKSWDQAKKAAAEAVAVATKHGSDRECAEAFNALFRHNLNSQKLAAAAESGKTAVAWSEKAYGEPEMQLTMDVGLLLLNIGKPAEAIPILEKSLKAREKWKDDLETSAEPVRTRTGKYAEQDLQNIQNVRHSLAWTLLHYCNALRAVNRNEQATDAVQKSIRLLEELPRPDYVDCLSQSYVTLADCDLRLNNLDGASFACNKAIKLFEASPNPAVRRLHVPLAKQQQKQIEEMIEARQRATPESPGMGSEKPTGSTDKPASSTEKQLTSTEGKSD